MVRQSKETNSDFQKLLKERIEKANPRRKLSAQKKPYVLIKLEAIAEKLKREKTCCSSLNKSIILDWLTNRGVR